VMYPAAQAKKGPRATHLLAAWAFAAIAGIAQIDGSAVASGRACSGWERTVGLHTTRFSAVLDLTDGHH
jgi:hypothetical protein